MGVLDEGRQQQGGGTRPPKQHQGGEGLSVDLSMARTQVEANEIIHNQLTAQGLVNGTKAYQEAMSQAWTEGNVAALPMN